jgi:hypothetical protein
LGRHLACAEILTQRRKGAKAQKGRDFSAGRPVRKYRDPKLNSGNLAIVYATAGHEVRAWFLQAGTSGLRQFCIEMRSGTVFPDAYADAKRKQPCRQ